MGVQGNPVAFEDDVPVFRAPMRSRDETVPDGAGVERALREGLCGLGGRSSATPASLDEATAFAAREHDERLARRIRRFADAPRGAFVWTRDADGLLWLGRIAGEWRYDGSEDATDVDLVHVRDCDWRGDPIDDRDAPGAVRAAFARGGRNWQRIRSDQVLAATESIWRRGSDR